MNRYWLVQISIRVEDERQSNVRLVLNCGYDHLDIAGVIRSLAFNPCASGYLQAERTEIGSKLTKLSRMCYSQLRKGQACVEILRYQSGKQFFQPHDHCLVTTVSSGMLSVISFILMWAVNPIHQVCDDTNLQYVAYIHSYGVLYCVGFRQLGR